MAISIAFGALLGMAVPRAEASHTAQTSFSPYAFGDSSCSTIVDPIGVVFTWGTGSHSEVYNHAKLSNHGGWSDQTNSAQYFNETEYGCTSNDNWASSNNGILRDRYHMRYEVDWVAETGHTSAATPHWDNFDSRDGTHCIRPAQGGQPSGFTKGVNDIVSNWITNGNEHPVWTKVWWGNSTAIQKCHTWAYVHLGGGVYGWVPTGWEYAGGDGWVYYIKMQGAS